MTAATTIAQRAGIEALTNGADDAQVMKAAYVKRRDFVYAALIDMGFSVARPDGAFYLFAKNSDPTASKLTRIYARLGT